MITIPPESRAVRLAFACNFVLMGSYYILRPLRDTVATVVGVDRLHELFTATFVGTVIASVIYTALASRIRLSRLLPGTFWFWLSHILLFAALFHYQARNTFLSAVFYVWFSVFNLFMISVFWSLMVDLFAAAEAARNFAPIAAGGALGAIAGPLLTRVWVGSFGVSGLLCVAAAGFAFVIACLYALMREKRRPAVGGDSGQVSRLDHSLRGRQFEGFREIFTSPYVRNQAAFMLLMTWVNTVAYFCQTDLLTRAYSGLVERAQAIANVDLSVNILTAVMLFVGTGRIVKRFGVTVGLLLNPLLLIGGFLLAAVSPTLLMIQALQVVRCVGQYAVARPTREICFTVVEQNARYKAKNVVDTVVYRLGDVTSAWMQAGMRSMGFGIVGAAVLGVAGSVLWGLSAFSLGRRFESRRVSMQPQFAARIDA